MTKQKRKNDEPQNLLMRWIRAYLRWLRDDFRTYRLVYFSPLFILVAIIPFYFFGGNVPSIQSYAHSKHLIFPVLQLLADGPIRLGIYLGITLVSVLVLLVKARGFLSLIVLTIPIWGLVWSLGGMIVSWSYFRAPSDSAELDNYKYHLVTYKTRWGSSATEFIVYKCDSVGIQCDILFEDYILDYRKIDLEINDRKLNVPYTNCLGGYCSQGNAVSIDLDCAITTINQDECLGFRY